VDAPTKAFQSYLSRDNLRKTRVYEIGFGHDDQAECCRALAERFEDLRARFFKPENERIPSNLGMKSASDCDLNKEAPVQLFPGQEYPKSMHHAASPP
jgi:hypothetical protein